MEADIPEMMAMGRALHAESPRYSVLSYSDYKVEQMLQRCIVGTLVTEPAGGAFVAVKHGRLVGGIVGFITELFFSYEKIASDHTFYIVPEERGKGRAAVLLVQALEEWAAAQGAVDIVVGTSTRIEPEATASFYEKLGYQRYGYVMMKKVK